ncbi:MAG: hypothetical protein ACI4FN_03135 [Acutalibacteraceae bacterium]
MKQKLIDALKTCGFVEGKTLFLHGTMNPDEAYPESFVTFWADSTADAAHFDNGVKSYDWSFSVFFFSTDAALVNTKPDEIRAALRAAGFIPQGKGYDFASDEPTHTGWAMDFYATEYLS